MVTTQAFSETLSGNLNPFKNKEVKKVSLNEFHSAVKSAAAGNQTEWRKLVDYDFTAYLDLVVANISTSAKTYNRANVVYMLEHSILVERKVGVGERIFGVLPSGGSDFYLATKEFDDLAIVYSDTIINQNQPTVVEQNDMGLWSCFNPKGRFYKSFELPTDKETIVERIVERHDTVVVTEMGPVQYVQNYYNEYNYYPTQYETYNNSYGNTGWQPVPVASYLPVCVPGVGGYIAVSAGFYGWGVSAGFGFDPCFRAQVSIGGGYQYYYPNCPQVQQAVCNYVQQTSNNTNIVINNTINNTNTVVVNTPVVQTPRPIPTTTGINTGGSGTNPTDSTNTTGGGDFPGSGDNTGGDGTDGHNTGGSGKTDETNGDDLVYTGEPRQKQMNNPANEFSEVRPNGFQKPNTAVTRVNNVNSQELGNAIADYQRTHGGQKPTNVYTEVKPDGGVIYRMNNKPVEAKPNNLAYTANTQTRTFDVNQMGNGQSYTNGTTQTREFSNNNPTVFTNGNTQQRDFSNSSPTVFTNGTTQVRNWDNNPQGLTTSSSAVRTFDANQMNNTGYSNGNTQVRTFNNGPQVLSANTQQRDWSNANQSGSFNTTNSQPREFSVNQGQNFNATNNSVRSFDANQMNGASTFNTSGNNVRSSGPTQMSNSSPSGMVQQQRTGSPSAIRIR